VVRGGQLVGESASLCDKSTEPVQRLGVNHLVS